MPAGLQDVKEGKDYRFPVEEEEILKLWDDLDAFHEQLRRTEGRPEYIFYDGPPFATGLPHYGHLLAGTIKVCYIGHSSCMRPIYASFSLAILILAPTAANPCLSFSAGHRDEICHSHRPSRHSSFWMGLSRFAGGARDRQKA
jgi:hypothetical protein